MRTLDSINSHPDAWIVEWFDAEGYLVLAVAVDDPVTAAIYARRAVNDQFMLIREAGLTAKTVQMRKIAGDTSDDAE